MTPRRKGPITNRPAWSRRLSVVAAVLPLLAAAAVEPTPPVAAQETCLRTEGLMTLERTREGCSSPIDLCLRGKVVGKGLLGGAIWVFTAHSRSASGAAESYAGSTAIAVKTGTIATRTQAVIDGGHLALSDEVTGADVKEPRLMGAREIFQRGTGVLSAKGAGSLTDGFPVEVTGEICLGK